MVERTAGRAATGLGTSAEVTIVLASSSPRRLQLLRQAGVDVVVRRPDIDETPLPGESPTDYVARLSACKAAAVARPGEVVIAADTTVERDGDILEKPLDDDEARAMLRSLSGRAHHAHTAVTVTGHGSTETVVVTTEVRFIELTESMIDWYVATGEPADKAGAYAIQGSAAAFVERVDGSVSNVVGLPLAETLTLLQRATR